MRSKLSTKVTFPLRHLDLSPYMRKDLVPKTASTYRLYAMVTHNGNASVSGHYTTFVSHQDTHSWYDINDTEVRRVAEEDVEKAQAYMLFYELETASTK